MIKWIIFYASLTGISEPKEGQILFFEADSVRMFDTVWKIKEMDHIEEYGDKLYRGHFRITYKDSIQAQLLVEGMSVIFHIEGKDATVITVRQIPHYDYLYEDVEEYNIIKKTTTDDKPKFKRNDRRKGG